LGLILIFIPFVRQFCSHDCLLLWIMAFVAWQEEEMMILL
jgi:hypothetical protein